MSSLTILGDTSGSVVLQAPAVSGSTTVNIGATTGTIQAGAPAVSARASTNQTINSTTETKVLFDTKIFDTNNCFASSRFTPTVAGYYQVSGALAYTASVTGYTTVYLWKNGARYAQMAEIQLSTAAYWGIPYAILVYCNGTTDYLEIYTLNQSGGIVYGDPSLSYTYFNACWVRGA